MSGFGIKDCLTEASLGRKCFGKYNKNRDFYTINEKYVRKFLRRSIKGVRLVALSRYFESNQFEAKLKTIRNI